MLTRSAKCRRVSISRPPHRWRPRSSQAGPACPPPSRQTAADTCSDWTSNGADKGFVGHHDRNGLRDDAPSRSWNASHPSRGCSKEDLPKSGGNGVFYCFAAKSRCSPVIPATADLGK
jgi:hypothetical protein